MKYPLHYSILFMALSIFGLRAQIADQSDIIIYKATNDKFHDISLQSHKNLPRFGLINRYTRYDPRGRPMRADIATREKVKTINLGYLNYYNLIAFKYMSDLYNDMDKERLTPSIDDQNKTEQLVNSFTAQRHLQKVIKTTYVDDRYKNGFQGVNTFETLRNYKTFIKEEFPDLQKWSQSFLTNDNTEGYLVSRLSTGTYDFDKNGYWVRISFDYAPNRAKSHGLLFNPKTNYGEQLLKTMGTISNKTKTIEVFLSLAPKKAEELLKSNIRSLYLVQKIGLSFEKVQKIGYNSLLFLNYHHKSPKLEVFEDEGLTRAVGAISLDNLTLKN